MPFGEEEAFRENEIEKPFKRYKEKARSYFLRESDEDQVFDELLFEPKTYCLFGNFDLAILSLVDSFGLATRSFHPFSHLMSDHHDRDINYVPHNYTFHVISGLAPNLKTVNSQEPDLLERAKATFLSKRDDLPFIGISSFKFNNSLITGGGGEFVDLALRAIQPRLAAAQQAADKPFQYLIFYSFSWHELSVIFFSDNFTTIADQVFNLRELVVEDLQKACESTPSYDYGKITSSTLLHKLLEDDPTEQNTDKLHNAHLFVHSNTILGYDSDILLGDQSALPDQSEEELTFRICWDIKPGHLSAFLEDLNTFENTSLARLIKEKGRITAGRGDYAYIIEEKAMDRFVEIVQLIIKSPLSKHIRKVNTTPTFSSEFRKKIGRIVDLDQHYLANDKLSSYRFKLDEIGGLRASLRKLRVPKIIQEKVNNMYTIFNDGISDPILYNYFVELRPYLEEVIYHIKDTVESSKGKSVLEITDRLNDITKDFETAYQNRFGQSYIMNEITDFNLKFNGGIQQLVSLFDGAYKTLTSFFINEGDYSRSMAFVAGVSNTMSGQLSVRLNYFHLYQPVFFAATATHEAVNFFPHHRYPSRDLDPDIFLLLKKIKNPTKEEEYKNGFPEKEHLHYFLVDIITFYTTYAEDFELFYYWRLSVYMQMGIAYNVDGSMQQKQFNMLVTRLYLLARLTENTAVFEGAFYPPFRPLNESFRYAWEKAFMHARVEGDRFFTENFELLLAAKKLATGQVIFDFMQAIRELDDDEAKLAFQALLPSDQANTEEDLQGFGDDDLFYGTMFNKRQEHIKRISRQIRASFVSGETYSFIKDRRHPQLQMASDAFFLQAMMLAYLQLIKELNKGGISILPRSSEDGKIARVQLEQSTTNRLQAESDIWFDPSGGFFTTNAAIRVTYFKYRSVFLKSLWSFSAKRKLKLFEGILQRRREE